MKAKVKAHGDENDPDSCLPVHDNVFCLMATGLTVYLFPKASQ